MLPGEENIKPLSILTINDLRGRGYTLLACKQARSPSKALVGSVSLPASLYSRCYWTFSGQSRSGLASFGPASGQPRSGSGQLRFAAASGSFRSLLVASGHFRSRRSPLVLSAPHWSGQSLSPRPAPGRLFWPLAAPAKARGGPVCTPLASATGPGPHFRSGWHERDVLICPPASSWPSQHCRDFSASARLQG